MPGGRDQHRAFGQGVREIDPRGLAGPTVIVFGSPAAYPSGGWTRSPCNRRVPVCRSGSAVAVVPVAALVVADLGRLPLVSVSVKHAPASDSLFGSYLRISRLPVFGASVAVGSPSAAHR